MASQSISIRAARPDDLAALLSIENHAFQDPWTAEHFTEDECLVAVADNDILGFLVYRVLDREEGEILNLAVREDRRRGGIASALLRFHLEAPEQQGRRWFLEVRPSNIPAQNLYRHFGFEEVGRRPRYYRNPTESAIVMRRSTVLPLQ